MIYGFRLMLVVVLGLFVVPSFADIEVVTDEFRQAQQDEVRQIVNAVEQVTSEIFGIDMSQVEDGTKIEMHLLQRDYENAAKALTQNGQLSNDWAFVRTHDKQGHVALQPPVEREVLDSAGLPLQTKVQLARVAAYLCMSRAFETEAWHPDWFSEGLSNHIADEALRSMGGMGTREDEPWTGRPFFIVQEAFEKFPKFTTDQILSDEEKDLSNSQWYAMNGLFIDWLSEIGALDKLIDQADKVPASDAYPKGLETRTRTILSELGVENPDHDFKEWVSSVKPMWNQLTRSLQTTGDAWFHCAFDNTNAVCWKQEPLGDRNWEISGSIQIFEGDKSQMNVLLGQSEAGYLSVAMGPTFGVTVFHRQYTDDGKKSSWNRLEHKEFQTFEKDEWVEFKITKRNDRLMIKINRERPVMVDVSKIDLSGNWGLGCQNQSAGMWRDVKFER